MLLGILALPQAGRKKPHGGECQNAEFGCTNNVEDLTGERGGITKDAFLRAPFRVIGSDHFEITQVGWFHRDYKRRVHF